MEKRIDSFSGNKYYLIGKSSCDEIVWLQRPKWDCGWYWGCNYLTTFEYMSGKPCPFPYKAYDIYSHSHFVLNECKGENYLNSYIEIVECPVELAKLKTLLADVERYKYIAQKQPSKYNVINLELLPNLFEEVEKLLLPNGCTFPIDKHSNFKKIPLLNSK